MSIFDKRTCDICGKSSGIGAIGNRKLEDGNMCKECAKLLSPHFSERRQSTVDEIRAQLAYREANKNAVAAFNVTRTYGLGTKIYVDDNAQKIIITSSSRWQSENPDVIDFIQVTGSSVDVATNRREEKYKNSEGKDVSYSPPRYINSYNFDIIVHINSPWFNEIRFRLNPSAVEDSPSGGSFLGNIVSGVGSSLEFQRYEALGQEIRDTMNQLQYIARGGQPGGVPCGGVPYGAPPAQPYGAPIVGASPVAQPYGAPPAQPYGAPAAFAPAVPQPSEVKCPTCGATTAITANRRCEYCDQPL